MRRIRRVRSSVADERRRALAQSREKVLRFIIGTSAERQKIVGDLVQRLNTDDPQILKLAALALADDPSRLRVLRSFRNTSATFSLRL